MSKFIPYPMFCDDMPIDISFVFGDEAPAGKHGFLKADGDIFRFEDGTEARFWGVNINGGANFPSHAYAKDFASRLHMTGCNLVRFHQLDAEWDIPNIFRFKRGKRVVDTQHFDPESMDRLDYLIYALKEKGIYIYFDMLTYRRFKEGDGFENSYDLGDSSRQPYAIFDRKMIELQKKFMHDIWNHYNPYTGLKYKDDPAIALTEIINESDLDRERKYGVEPYTSDFKSRMRKWLDENGIEYDIEGADLTEDRGPIVTKFKAKLQTEYYLEMIEYQRSIGVKIPIAGTNYNQVDTMVKTQLVADFTDNHTYLCDWKWNDGIAAYKSLTQIENPATQILTKYRMKNMPFFVSEWDVPWPNPYRAESPLLFAAIGSYQKWSGYAIHTYSYSTRLNEMKVLGKELHAPCVNGIAYRVGMFSTWNDPAKYGLFYHAALMMRRGDVVPTDKEITLRIGENGQHNYEGFNVAPEMCRIYSSFDEGQDANIPPYDPADGEVKSVDGQLYRSWKDNYGYINTEFTKAVYGMLSKNGKIEIDGLSIESTNDHGVLAFSSISDKPLAESDNILLTAIGDAVNTGYEYERVGETDMRVKSMGQAPVLAEVIEADICLKNCFGGARVMAIDPQGFFIGRIPSTYEDGCLKFHIGAQYESMYYLIIKD